MYALRPDHVKMVHKLRKVAASAVEKHEKRQQGGVGPSESTPSYSYVWMIEIGKCVSGDVISCLWSNDADAPCLTDQTNDSPSSAPQPVPDI